MRPRIRSQRGGSLSIGVVANAQLSAESSSLRRRDAAATSSVWRDIAVAPIIICISSERV